MINIVTILIGNLSIKKQGWIKRKNFSVKKIDINALGKIEQTKAQKKRDKTFLTTII